MAVQQTGGSHSLASSAHHEPSDGYRGITVHAVATALVLLSLLPAPSVER